MTEVLFYHLTESRAEQQLPGLLERSLERGWKAVVQCVSDQTCRDLDEHLWTWRDESFLPHAAQGGEPDGNPIWLTTRDDNPICANVRFLLEGATCKDANHYDRVILLFDGHDADALAGARQQWKAHNAEGFDLTYYQQDGGRWVKKG
ncbi:MAG: DNA polymerase III subunit chi [Ahrensia sp.]|nr:DNA polymerase III subunit chi [Ahrensia sp.]